MTWTLWRYLVRESLGLWASCASVLFAFCWVRVWLVAHLDMTRFRNIIENLPQRWERFSPVPFEQLFTYEGRIAMAYEEPLVYLVIVVWAIVRGSDAICGHLGRGTFELVLSTPLSRARWLAMHTAVSLLGTACLGLAAWGGTQTGIATTSVRQEPALVVPFPSVWSNWEERWKQFDAAARSTDRTPDATGPHPSPGDVKPSQVDAVVQGETPRLVPMRDLVDRSIFFPAARNLTSLGVFLLGVTTLIGCWDQYRWRTIGLSVGLCVMQMVMEIVGMAAEGYRWLRTASFFGAYEPVAIAMGVHRQRDTTWQLWFRDGATWGLGPVGYDLVLVALGTLCLALAFYRFHSRDLPAPI